ncbi:MAG: sigma-54-dependent Fis family transcriptional regulator [Acidobacteria bacterium]|uniref:Sigma-54-dependent Fis family transcriptional regulator n=1 Tax=Candidatus Polarisedimenticola svalbardensis TaxID=2886004 RepID=A0A8J6Y5R9_9BACT|nr:sigma-54-dependent Fis family transcriptional regulator [Candidatus Polarisedimenticola svalbardensis]
MATILVADDERNIRNSLATALKLEGFDPVMAEDGRQALDVLAAGSIDLAILDLQMPVMGGLATLAAMREQGHDIPVMILTAHGSVEKAMEAVRAGAYDFIEKPPHSEKILLSIRNALRQVVLEDENRELRAAAGGRYHMIGTSPPMETLYEQIRKVAPTQARVLILGENGTGKELVARAIHEHSPRAGKPFIGVNCAAVPRDLFESELFGHEKGSFTGATARRKGRFVRADGGTLFLDEVAEIPVDLQSKILRSLESGEVEPVGSDREVRVDVRVLAATNRDLEKEVAEGRFREDLYYRLKVVHMTAPPLRDRREDIPALVEHFLESVAKENNLRPVAMAKPALDGLLSYGFPGNVRELRNMVERLVILSPGDRIEEQDVVEGLPQGGAAGPSGLRTEGRPLREVMADLERDVIGGALRRNRWKMTAAARELDLERSHLYKKVKALGIQKPDNE